MRTSVATLVIGSLLTASPASAQDLLRDFSAGLGVGLLNEAPTQFSDSYCGGETSSSLRVHGRYDITDLFYLTAGWSRSTEDPVVCDNGLIRPIPEEGPHTTHRVQVDPQIAGYPVTATDIQLGLQAESRIMGMRAGVGPVWFHGKGIRGTAASIIFSARIPGVPIAGTLSFDRFRMRIPHTEVERHYMDGELVDVQVTPQRSAERMSGARLGVEITH